MTYFVRKQSKSSGSDVNASPKMSVFDLFLLRFSIKKCAFVASISEQSVSNVTDRHEATDITETIAVWF